ncbi:thioredoxin-disulfide reductase [Myxococcota bacterium]|nr:thioredoxin-disulfide reductase [Myxococcota bacterium]MBU1411323.1 thioredoxin-disulfide reductase [Myxococcota bacterium]MBU1509126.1 thioredoxin-disulfide reductase [Myxococcota bacterium]
MTEQIDSSSAVSSADPENLLIVGSGPAGLTAALYAGRAGLNPLVIEGMMAGGQLMDTTEVENFPGYPKGIRGPELIEDLRTQALRFSTRIVSDEVTAMDLAGHPKSLTLASGAVIRARAVILATGATARYLGLPSEQKLRGYGVSACAVCDGFFYRDQDVAVIGGGDSALEDALFLTHHARSITVVHRRDSLRASKIMQERALSNPKISFAWNSQILEVLGDPGDSGVTGLRLRDVHTGAERVLPVTGMFVAIGHDPNTLLVRDQVELDGAGFILTRAQTTQTNLEGVFAAGDVMDPRYKQAITAAGTGCKSALDAERWLMEQGS